LTPTPDQLHQPNPTLQRTKCVPKMQINRYRPPLPSILCREGGFRNKEYTLAAFLDLEGAFNNVTPTAIIGALTELGIERPIMGLTSRIVYSTMGSAHSTRTVSRGTPQGCVLSPLLWVIVFHKLLSLLEEAGTKVVAYADNVVIVLQGKFSQTLCNLMETAPFTLSGWTADCGLGVNPEKTELVIFSKKYKIPSLTLPKLHQTCLALSNQAKYLGVILNKNSTGRTTLPHT